MAASVASGPNGTMRSMWLIASVLGIDASSWSVIVAAVALAVSAYSLLGARGSAGASNRSAEAAERSADATTASAQAAERAAGAAETSAQHSERSAAAAERLAAAHERTVELDEQRAIHESRERAGRDAPRWAAVGEHEGAWWISDDNHLHGVLVNAGRVGAQVTDAVVDLPTGGRVLGRYRADPQGPADGGFVSALSVRPGGAMHVEFETSDGSLGQALSGDVRPRVTISASNEELPWHGEGVVELLRQSGGVASATRWKPRGVD